MRDSDHVLPLRVLGFLMLMPFLGLACSSSEIGESCDDEGQTEECVDNAVCAKDNSSQLKCLKICTEQSQCAPNEECNGVTGSNLKACNIKK